jgi:hypothetical protein
MPAWVQAGDRATGPPAYDDPDQQTLFRRWLEVPARNGGKNQMGFIPNIGEMKDTVEEAFDLLRRAVLALEELAAEQKRTNDLYTEVNQISLAHTPSATLRMTAGSTSALDGGA